MRDFLRPFNPRWHIAAAIGWAVFLVVTLAALLAANLAASQADSRAREDATSLLVEFATQVRDALSMNVKARRSVLQATAAQVAAADALHAEAMLRTFETVQAQFPEFVWLGVADGDGVVVVATQGRQVGDNVSASPWFQQGRQQPFVGDLRMPPGAAEAASSAAGAAPLGLIDMAVPVRPAGRREPHVIGASVTWAWVEQELAKMQEALSKRHEVQLLLVGRDGVILAGPDAWRGRNANEHDLTEGGAYVIGARTQLRLADGMGLGWTAIVRQDADFVLAPVRSTRRTVFMTVFLAGLLSAVAAAAVTRVLTSRLTLLAEGAEAVRSGAHRTLTPPAGNDEVSRIGATLAEVVEHLQAEKQALQALNVELDRRVAERTVRIERMADEARHAAVTRERLRIARDMHDTLAHSLMALLTQIRLVRKLHPRMTADEVDAELGRAEEAASGGLVEARAAILRMRDNGLRDTGLGPALQDLAKRFGERTGITVSIDADPAPAGWADDRAETVFRILEEALRNIERHAQARSVGITLRRGTFADDATAAVAGTLISISDDGVGFDPAAPRPGHYGLLGMHEQALLIDARLRIHSAPGEGTRIELLFPG
ncbi:sensor histidine kinase [Ideonella sp.]|uniref:sensor histidine kinase n=1 Tax=Ideonella sp. TaxID=1929293 RepID=UPI0035B2A2F3